VAITFCLPPRPGELCAPLLLELASDHTTQQLTARHRVTGLECTEDGRVRVAIEITDPATARPVDVHFDVVPKGTTLGRHSLLIGTIHRGGTELDVLGTYLGPVADEN